MFMFKLGAFVQCFINNAEGFVEIFLYHEAKIPNYSRFVPVFFIYGGIFLTYQKEKNESNKFKRYRRN
jgi:hypothetical protein